MPDAVAKQVERFLDHLAVERGLAANTVEAYRRDLVRYVGFLRVRGLRDARRAEEQEVASFAAELSSTRRGDGEPYRTSSIVRSVSACNAVEEVVISNSPN